MVPQGLFRNSVEHLLQQFEGEDGAYFEGYQHPDNRNRKFDLPELFPVPIYLLCGQRNNP